MYTSDVNENSGRYGCTVENAIGSITQEVNIIGKSPTIHFTAQSMRVNIVVCTGISVSEHRVLALGSTATITCSSDFGVNAIEWRHGGQVVSRNESSEGVLNIERVSETDHGRRYTCRAVAPFGVQEHNVILQLEGTTS